MNEHVPPSFTSSEWAVLLAAVLAGGCDVEQPVPLDRKSVV